MAFHKLVRPIAVGIWLSLAAGATAAVEKDKLNTLIPKEIAEGWVLLFDGESTFGWTAFAGTEGKKSELTAKDGTLGVRGSDGGIRLDTLLRYFELTCEYRCPPGEVHYLTAVPMLGGESKGLAMSWNLVSEKDGEWVRYRARFDPDNIRMTGRPDDPPVVQGARTAFRYDAVQLKFDLPTKQAGRIELRNLKLRPLEATPLFNQKDLTGWKPYAGDPKRERSKFAVTAAGELSVKDGPGDLQSEKAFDDFVLQLECKTNGKALNSGVFFRCLPGQYQQGYEAQIQNAFKDNDRTKPTDFGTGAIYRRVPARKVVPNDNEWFAMTVLARGPHISTWVNGYPVVSWTDDRKPADNARQGLYTKKGPISLQGHDPTTDLLFRNIRIAELK